jgi:hypothetical protein
LLSMAYFDGFLLLIALLSALRELTAPAAALTSDKRQPEAPAMIVPGRYEPARPARPP